MRILKKFIVSMVTFLTVSLYLCNATLAQQMPFYAARTDQADQNITEHKPKIQMTPEISLPNEKYELGDKWMWLLGGLLLVLGGVAAASGGGGGGDESDDSSSSNVTVRW